MEEAQIQEELLMRSNNNKEQINILKGKRTKRQRPQSPIPFVVNSGDHVDHKNVTNILSPAVSSGDEYFESTEEDEDMANCLILLAQCQSRELSPKRVGNQEEIGKIQSKFNSRRFLEAPSSGTGKAGYYVYVCKTCNRTFPSFQALGGHRASHKKPKAMNDKRLINNKSQQFLVSSDEEEGNFRNVSSSLSLQLSNNSNNRGMNMNSNLYINSSNNGHNKSNKVHECSICGAEFTSGQALGGHMRRHRAPVGTNTTLSLTPMAVQPPDQVKKKTRNINNVLSLDLDLNLPAPEDAQGEIPKLTFSSSKQQHHHHQQQQQQKSTLVFSAAPTLVDCHY